ncbi:acyl-CoA dehydrogenase family protein [Nocardia cyriacigeorgica]|uniref:acyl-CoA dehydrogenase family protein n=1 Tax=Nocardia cyriacigeorgica TaxID=135487 RepID=UPI0024542288|nr:acyl-CoA dehydrogenase family protein [Nocardia cyriacigeorgica]
MVTSGNWRERLTALLADFATWPPATSREDKARLARKWQSALVDAGVAAPGWPQAAGGLELGVQDQIDYYRMLSAARVPKHPNPVAFILASTLIQHGSEQQRKRFLEPLLRADETWCQGFSEPGAGSDLAAVSTTAVRSGDTYTVTGQKIWTTGATTADWMFALVRTGPAGTGPAGMSYLLIPLTSPGVEVRPLRDATGGYRFAEVHLNEVVVPAENLVGAEGDGWAVMRTSLGHERATAFIADEFRYRGLVDEVFRLAVAQGYADDAVVRQELAHLESGVGAIVANSARALEATLRGADPGAVASINRLVKSEFEQRVHRLAHRLTGPAGALGGRSPSGRWAYGYLMTRASTIGAGTAEIQRNTIAEGVLGLPGRHREQVRSNPARRGHPLVSPGADETALREAIAAAIGARTGMDQLLARADEPSGYDVGVWNALVRFGLPGLAMPQRLSGAGAGRRALCAAIETVAYHLAPVPLLPTAIALEVLYRAGAEDHVRALCAGATAALAAPVGDAGWVIDDRLPLLSGRAVTGTVERVAGAPVAAHMVVLARDASGDPVLASVAREDVTVMPQPAVDVTGTIGTLTLDAATVVEHARGEDAVRVLAEARSSAQLMLAADSVGVAARSLALAIGWAGSREQFGQPIGSYQAISHKCADMLIDVESARAQVLSAAERPADDASAADLATAAALEAAVSAAEDCLQIHGAVGFTWAHPAHLLLRRAVSNRVLLTRPEALRDRAARSIIAALS